VDHSGIIIECKPMLHAETFACQGRVFLPSNETWRFMGGKAMDFGVTVLNFDQGYVQQSFLKNETCRWVDLDTISGTNLYCESRALRQIAGKLQPCRGKNITFIGSGNYHYVTFLLLSQVRKPFTLILFDHHTDMLPSPEKSLISCGSWVLDSLEKVPWLENVLMIGVAENWIEQIPVSLRGRIAAFSESQLHANRSSVIPSVLDSIAADSVYISVDKDVLNPAEAATVWDQGSMKLHQVLEIVDAIAAKKEICGFDVCGEYPFTPAYRFQKQAREAVAKNDYANHVILEHLKAAELF